MKPSASLVSVAVLSAALLGACASGERQSGTVVPQEQKPPGTAAPTAQGQPANQPSGQPAGPSVHWRTRLEGDTVVVEVRDRANAYRVDRVELIAPDGRSFAARDIVRERLRDDGMWSRGGSGVGIGVGGWGGSSSGVNLGVGLGFPLGGGRGGDIEDETRTTARIPLPDAAAYRANPANWVVRVTFNDLTGQTSSAAVPAPRPE